MRVINSSVLLGEAQVGEFTLADLKSRGIKNNNIASLHIPTGFTVTLYQDNYYNGGKVYSASTSLKAAFLVTTSSIKIEEVDLRDEFVHIRSLRGDGDYCLDADSSTAHLNAGRVGISPCSRF